MVIDSSANIPCNAADIAATATSVINEKREKDKRRLNIIVHNLDESENEDMTKRKSYDYLRQTSSSETQAFVFIFILQTTKQ